MAKPIIKTIKSFNSKDSVTIEFTYSGNQSYNNKVTIYDANTLAVVYDKMAPESERKKCTHTIPGGTLANDKQYSITVQSFDINNVGSSVSDKIYFWTITTPTFEFADIHSGDTIRNSSYLASINYHQVAGIKLEQVRFFLYHGGTQYIRSSDTIYTTGDATYNYYFDNNDSNYQLRMTGITEHGMELDTGMINVHILYENPGAYAIIYATEDGTGTGTVNYWTNVSVIRPTREDYEIKDSTIDLRDDYITYESGFVIPGNFTFAIRHTYFVGEIARIKSDNNTLILSIVEFSNGFRYKLVVDGKYKIYSDLVEGNDDNVGFLTVYVRNIGNIYDIYLHYELDYLLRDYNIWLYGDTPAAKKYDIWEDVDANRKATDKDIVVSEHEPTCKPIWIGGTE